MKRQLRILAVGESAVLVELDSLAHVLGVQAMLRRQRLPGVVEIVAAAQTVLITCDSPAAAQAVRAVLAAADPGAPAPVPVSIHTINTRYDGDDLTETARLTGLSVDAVIAWHSGQDWVAAFGGFAPGFMYLAALDTALLVPRRTVPRTVVPAGSVAAGGEFSAVYPGPTPGGWQLLGRCADTLWDARRAQPALIQPGDTVRFTPVRELIELGAVQPTAPTAHSTTGISGLQVLTAGVQTTVQDLGRPGFAHLGVTASGALDRAALRRANRMAGNGGSHQIPADQTAGAAGLETVLSGLSVKAVGTHVLAVAGGAAILRIRGTQGEDRRVPANAPFLLLNGETLTFHQRRGATGFRSYLAVRGGLDVPTELGSRSTDVLSGLGPNPVTAGTFLPVAPAPSGHIVGVAEPAPPPPPEVTELRYLPGPRHDWFTPASLATFEQQIWQATAQSNRIGLRLAGTPLQRTESAVASELPSEGMANGAIQVPPSGLPVLFLADHPVTGGYPVLGVVLREDLDRAAQLAPGTQVRFRSAGGEAARLGILRG